MTIDLHLSGTKEEMADVFALLAGKPVAVGTQTQEDATDSEAAKKKRRTKEEIAADKLKGEQENLGTFANSANHESLKVPVVENTALGENKSTFVGSGEEAKAENTKSEPAPVATHTDEEVRAAVKPLAGTLGLAKIAEMLAVFGVDNITKLKPNDRIKLMNGIRTYGKDTVAADHFKAGAVEEIPDSEFPF